MRLFLIALLIAISYAQTACQSYPQNFHDGSTHYLKSCNWWKHHEGGFTNHCVYQGMKVCAYCNQCTSAGAQDIGSPTMAPTAGPSILPTMTPTAGPTKAPTAGPSISPTMTPTAGPSISPTMTPTAGRPTMTPTASPSISPTDAPSFTSTLRPSGDPSAIESSIQTDSGSVHLSIELKALALVFGILLIFLCCCICYLLRNRGNDVITIADSEATPEGTVTAWMPRPSAPSISTFLKQTDPEDPKGEKNSYDGFANAETVPSSKDRTNLSPASHPYADLQASSPTPRQEVNSDGEIVDMLYKVGFSNVVNDGDMRTTLSPGSHPYADLHAVSPQLQAHSPRHAHSCSDLDFMASKSSSSMRSRHQSDVRRLYREEGERESRTFSTTN